MTRTGGFVTYPVKNFAAASYTRVITITVAAMVLLASTWLLIATPINQRRLCEAETVAAAMVDGATATQAHQIAQGACR